VQPLDIMYPELWAATQQGRSAAGPIGSDEVKLGLPLYLAVPVIKLEPAVVSTS
jgi:hypothetical protein